DCKKCFLAYWNDVVLQRDLMALADEVRACRIRVTRKQEQKSEKFRLTFAVDSRVPDLERYLVQYLKTVGGERK
ncbi:unnamed protein product, partial [Prorocentrum cordatum]